MKHCQIFHNCIFSFLSSLIPLSQKMSFQQLFFEGVLGSSFSTRTSACGVCKDVCVELFEESNDVLVIVGTAKQSGAGVTNSSDLRRTLLVHALSSTSVEDLVIIGSVKVHEVSSSLSSSHPFQYGEGSRIPSTICNMRPSGYYAWDTQVMVP